FVEGDDVPILAHLARQIGATQVAASDKYATIPLGGFSRHSLASAFSETMHALGGSVKTVVVLDRDLRSDEAVRLETAELAKSDTDLHVWQRRELENYLLSPGALAAAARVPLARAEEILARAVADGEDEARKTLIARRLHDQRVKGSKTAKYAPETVVDAATDEFHSLWSSEQGRLAVVDAMAVSGRLNTVLQASGAKTINALSLAKNVPASDVGDEIRNVISRIEELIT
ncbi:MAG: hypothetical protein ACRDPS_23655, partial [Nocardioides sp.]|uniref:hypothetical protein n=1 Tax=Nocardioides sp. TaxID=35761 RepID=UPI003D6B31A5